MGDVYVVVQEAENHERIGSEGVRVCCMKHK